MARSYHQGKYNPVHPEKYVGNVKDIVYRSSWERRFCYYCDMNPDVIYWASEPKPVPYINSLDGKQHRYFIDFFVKIVDKEGKTRKLAIEIKPYVQTIPPKQTNRKRKSFLNECQTYQINQDKWKYARAWAQENGFEFIVLTEYDLGIAQKKD